MCRLLQHKGANLRGLETAISHRLASVVDLQWPSKRWPIHVFTAGAMTCLATSTVCHLFSNFGFKNIQVSSPGNQAGESYAVNSCVDGQGKLSNYYYYYSPK